MTTKELERKIKEICKEVYGEKLTYAQIKAVLEAFKEVSIEACKNGDSVSLRKFITISGAMTVSRTLPNGTVNKPRLKIKAVVSKSLQEDFKKDLADEEE